MSEKEKAEESNNDANDSKAKFREALEKRQKYRGSVNFNLTDKSKIQGDQESRGAPKMFRRKSGSA